MNKQKMLEILKKEIGWELYTHDEACKSRKATLNTIMDLISKKINTKRKKTVKK